MTKDPGPTAAPAPDQVQLAWKRTFLAYERTLMAWVRTSTSLITFGFTLYKFFAFLRETQLGKQPPQLLSTHVYGLLMMGIGVFILVLAATQHRTQMKELRKYYGEAPMSLAAVLAALVGGLGVLAFLAALFRQ